MTKVESLEQYFELAPRTMSWLDNSEQDSLHMMYGVGSEIGELMDAVKKHIAYKKPFDVVNVLEEIGDITWYIAGVVAGVEKMYTEKRIKSRLASRVLDKTEEGRKVYLKNLDETRAEKSLEVFSDEVIKTITFIELIQKVEAQKHLSFLHGEDYLEVVLVMCTVFVNSLGEDILTVLTKNINKLEQRYPEKFTFDKALNRDLDAERQILESPISDDTAKN